MSHPRSTIGAMSAEHFSPWRADCRPCWHCTGYDGIVTGGALCNRPGCCRLRSQPENGCSAFEREVGADDEPVLLADAYPLPA